jgi:hypothetical protein
MACTLSIQNLNRAKDMIVESKCRCCERPVDEHYNEDTSPGLTRNGLDDDP